MKSKADLPLVLILSLFFIFSFTFGWSDADAAMPPGFEYSPASIRVVIDGEAVGKQMKIGEEDATSDEVTPDTGIKGESDDSISGPPASPVETDDVTADLQSKIRNFQEETYQNLLDSLKKIVRFQQAIVFFEEISGIYWPPPENPVEIQKGMYEVLWTSQMASNFILKAYNLRLEAFLEEVEGNENFEGRLDKLYPPEGFFLFSPKPLPWSNPLVCERKNSLDT